LRTDASSSANRIRGLALSPISGLRQAGAFRVLAARVRTTHLRLR